MIKQEKLNIFIVKPLVSFHSLEENNEQEVTYTHEA